MARFQFILGLLLASQRRVAAFQPSQTAVTTCTRTVGQAFTQLAMSTSTSPQSYMEALSFAASEALGREVTFESTSGGGFAGGGGASTSAVLDTKTNTKFFVKSARGELDMLRGEFEGVKAMSEAGGVKAPKPIAYGEYESTSQAFVIFEYLEFCGGGSQYELGQQLAKMHRADSGKGFGFVVDNTIGATFQPNLPWMKNWAEFWDKMRLGHMLKLTGNVGLSDATITELREKTKKLLSHNPPPSLCHGDLWGGNKAFCKADGNVVPVIFDPATYYGDREADIAMTYVFGGFSSEFYEGYNDEWPLPAGHDKRRVIYELYHILNHNVLFGGSYANQAKGMIDRILRL